MNNSSNSGNSQTTNNGNVGNQNSQTANNNGGNNSGMSGNNSSNSGNSQTSNNGNVGNQNSKTANTSDAASTSANSNIGASPTTKTVSSGNNSGNKSASGSKAKLASNKGNGNKTTSSGINKTRQANNSQASGANNNGANNPSASPPPAANTAANFQSNNNTIGNSNSNVARNDTDSTVVVSDTSLKVKQVKLPATFGYKRSTTTHDALLDSLANAVPKPKVSDSRSAKRLKIQEANTITNIQYTDTNAATLNQKSQNYFLAASSLVENAEKTRGKAQTEKDKNKSEALYHRADSLDDLIFQLNLKGDEALAEANYRQYYTNANQIASISIHPSKKLAYKVTAAKRMIHDADNSYRRSMSEKDRANISRILATKHTYIKSARQDLATAILRQQSAVYLYFQVDSDQTASTMGRATSDSSLHFTYSGFMKVKAKEDNRTSRSNGNIARKTATPEDNPNQNATPNTNPSVITKNPSPTVSENNAVKESIKPKTLSRPDTALNTVAASKKRTNKKTTHPKERNNNATTIAKTNTNVNADVLQPTENKTTHNNPVVENHTNPIIPEPGDIFKQLKRSPYSASNPIPIDPSLPMGLIFKVQIGAFKNPIKQNLFKGFEPIIGLTAPQGYIRYSAGLFKTLDPARVALAKIKDLGYPDAFIIAFYDGKRISIQEAMEKLGMPVAPAATAPANYQANIDSIAFARIQAEAAAKAKQDSSQTGRHNRKKKKGNDVNSAANTTANENKQPRTNVASSGDNKVVVIGKNTIKPTKKSIIDERKKSIKDTVPPKSKPIRNVKGLVYTVQVGSFPRHKDFVRLSKMKKLYSSTDENGVIKYSCGTYSSLADARAAKDIILANTSVRDAFISAYYNGKKISLTKAADLLSKGVETGATQPVDFSTNNATTPTSSANNTSSIPSATNQPSPVTATPAESNKPPVEDIVGKSFEDASKDHVIYTVQLGSYSGEVPVDVANRILAHANEGIEPHQEKHGVVTYYAGKFIGIDSANTLQQKLTGEGFQQAFIVAYYHGKKISLQEAQSINNK